MRHLALFFLLLSASALSTYAIFVIPEKPTAYVSDYAGLMSAPAKSALETKLANFTASTTSEIAVVTVPSLDGDTIENYAVRVFSKWGVGTKKNDNGVLLIISRDDRRARIEVGYGLEGALPDITASHILNETLIPDFKAGKIDEGITGAVDLIIKATQGEYTAPQASHGPQLDINLIVFFGFVGIQLLSFLSSILARSKSWWAGGVVGAVLGLLATFFQLFGLTLLIGLVISFFLSIFGLLFDYLVSNAYNQAKSSGASIPWWAGGNSSGWRSSSGGRSSFGGFRGGSSGGGGASGSW